MEHIKNNLHNISKQFHMMQTFYRFFISPKKEMPSYNFRCLILATQSEVRDIEDLRNIDKSQAKLTETTVA